MPRDYLQRVQNSPSLQSCKANTDGCCRRCRHRYLVAYRHMILSYRHMMFVLGKALQCAQNVFGSDWEHLTKERKPLTGPWAAMHGFGRRCSRRSTGLASNPGLGRPKQVLNLCLPAFILHHFAFFCFGMFWPPKHKSFLSWKLTWQALAPQASEFEAEIQPSGALPPKNWTSKWGSDSVTMKTLKKKKGGQYVYRCFGCFDYRHEF